MAERPPFDLSVEPGGYAWWYLDALSDDGRHGLTLIAFVGSVFSPYYAMRRRWGAADPEDHCAINVALYGDAGYRWTMTERGRRRLTRSPDRLSVGPSALAWTANGDLVIHIDEMAVPVPRRVRGTITVTPVTPGRTAFVINPSGRHIWQPVAPLARVRVAMDRDGPAWSGHAYVDHNRGDEPLEAAFRSWTWSRSIEPDRTAIDYDVILSDGCRHGLRATYRADGGPNVEPPGGGNDALVAFGTTLWRMPLVARATPGTTPRLLQSWEDGPFYARSLIEHDLGGQRTRSVHESLSLTRFSKPVVQAMLPFRMPRRS